MEIPVLRIEHPAMRNLSVVWRHIEGRYRRDGQAREPAQRAKGMALQWMIPATALEAFLGAQEQPGGRTAERAADDRYRPKTYHVIVECGEQQTVRSHES